MTFEQQSTALGYVGLVVVAAILIVIVLWLGSRQTREARARAFWRLAHVPSWLEMLASLMKR